MTFNNDDSEVKFIPEGTSVDEVIARDMAELKEIGGSMTAIAERMSYFQSKIWHFDEEERPRPIIGKVWDGVYEIEIPFDEDGPQECPYSECPSLGALDVGVVNTRTAKLLIINDITIHLAEEHQLLEKGNIYGISAKEFYKHFMD